MLDQYIIRQMCVKLRIDKAGLLGQSLGALFALGCAKDEELKDVLGETTVCLVSPWVPLAAPGKKYLPIPLSPNPAS